MTVFIIIISITVCNIPAYGLYNYKKLQIVLTTQDEIKTKLKKNYVNVTSYCLFRTSNSTFNLFEQKCQFFERRQLGIYILL